MRRRSSSSAFLASADALGLLGLARLLGLAFVLDFLCRGGLACRVGLGNFLGSLGLCCFPCLVGIRSFSRPLGLLGCFGVRELLGLVGLSGVLGDFFRAFLASSAAFASAAAWSRPLSWPPRPCAPRRPSWRPRRLFPPPSWHRQRPWRLHLLGFLRLWLRNLLRLVGLLASSAAFSAAFSASWAALASATFLASSAWLRSLRLVGLLGVLSGSFAAFFAPSAAFASAARLASSAFLASAAFFVSSALGVLGSFLGLLRLQRVLGLLDLSLALGRFRAAHFGQPPFLCVFWVSAGLTASGGTAGAGFRLCRLRRLLGRLGRCRLRLGNGLALGRGRGAFGQLAHDRLEPLARSRQPILARLAGGGLARHRNRRRGGFAAGAGAGGDRRRCGAAASREPAHDRLVLAVGILEPPQRRGPRIVAPRPALARARPASCPAPAPPAPLSGPR